jgi:hypothetical protein
MKKGDYVFVVRPQVMSGDKRPSLARVLHIDEDKTVVESTYRLTYGLPGTHDYSRWIVPTRQCIVVKEDVLRHATDKHTINEATLEENDLVMWIDDGNNIIEGIVISTTPKTVEILENGSLKVKRKKKDLVAKL